MGVLARSKRSTSTSNRRRRSRTGRATAGAAGALGDTAASAEKHDVSEPATPVTSAAKQRQPGRSAAENVLASPRRQPRAPKQRHPWLAPRAGGTASLLKSAGPCTG